MNQAHRFAELGIEGSVGVRYGPAPTWLYQGFLALSRDLELLVVLRAAITMVGCAIGLMWLARALRVNRWFVPITLASPYLWLYSRGIWDNTFLIPLAALSIGAYAEFLSHRRRTFLLLAMTCALVMPLVHLMALALVVPLFLHAAIFARGDLWRARYPMLVLIGAWLVIGHGYFIWQINNHSLIKTSGNLVAGTFPFIGGRWLSAISLDEFFQDSYREVVSNSIVLDIGRSFTVLMLPAVWVGMILTRDDLKSRASERREALIFILMIVGAQMLLNGVTGAVGPAHYFNATWPVFAALSWLTFERLVAFRWTRWIPAALGLSLVLVVGAIIVRIHQLGGTRGNAYGPTLANQIEIAHALNQYGADARIRTNVTNFQQFPQGLAVLRMLDGQPARTTRADTALTIDYAAGPASGRVALFPR
ncbi:MAG TPA: hypothetical protein VM099_01585 [Gemmatimonadaceae bacterium]|nr:hypothetical protein [Gemmatimonadaceae bacterium]